MKVSVIIPCYNHESYVVQAINSVLSQDWPEIELIVIDDGSSDNSVRVIQELLDENGGFSFIHRANKGIVRTLNEGLALATGQLICLCASDDYFLPGSIRKRAEFLVKNFDNVAVFSNAESFCSETGDIIGSLMDDKRREIFQATDPIPYFIRGLNLPIHTLMSRREVFLKIGGFDTRYHVCEDLDVQLLHFLEGKVGYLEEVVYRYRKHDSNISHNIKQKARLDMILLYKKYLEEVPKLKPYRPLLMHYLRRQYLRMGRYLTETSGGTLDEKLVFRGGWRFAWRDPRLLWHLIRWGW